MAGEQERQRPAVSLLDVITLGPVEAYAVLVHIAEDPDPAVAGALSDAVFRVLSRTRPGSPIFRNG